ncbi:MAG: NUDIX hydrolase [Acidimicrobiaceae bacterium]|nr:NUDIX hydrolase [Acidimicrobiaceae bacterium]
MKSRYEVLAGGGVLIQKGGHEKDQIFYGLVHRPRYNDWSFPKGKQENGEDPLACALREVQEETGYRCTPVMELMPTSYTDNRGRSKLVRYWLMTVEKGQFIPNDEVDSVAWLPYHLAINALTYSRDREILESAQFAVGQNQR